LTLTALLLSAFLLAPALDPGRYVGTTDAGQVWLELGTEGQASYGYASYKWRLEGGVLLLERPGAKLELAVKRVADGFVLEGPPFGRVDFRPAPLPTQIPAARPRRPQAWCGRWLHRATGGHLALELGADGRYLMTHGAVGASPQRTAGRWRAERGLVLTPDGGASQRYTVRLADGALFLAGGDLPIEVKFQSQGAP